MPDTNATVTPQQVAALVHAYRHHCRWSVVHLALLILFSGLFFMSQWETATWWLQAAYMITLAVFAWQLVDAVRALGALSVLGQATANSIKRGSR